MLKPKTKFSECIKVVKYAVKIVQNSAGMRIIMVSSICGIAYKNVCHKWYPQWSTRGFYSENKFVNEIPTVRKTQNGLKTCFYRLF